MTCSNCGKEINDGAAYCLECGAPIDEPVVLSEIKKAPDKRKVAAKTTNQKTEGSLFDLSGYVKGLGADTSILLGLLASVLVYLSPFFSWMGYKHFDVKKSGNLFELGGKNAELAVGEGIIIFMAILIMLSALDMLAFSGCKYISPLKKFENNYLLKAVPIVLTIIFMMVIIKCDRYELALNNIRSQAEIAKDLGGSFSYTESLRVGMIMLISGQVIYGVTVLLDIFKRGK